MWTRKLVWILLVVAFLHLAARIAFGSIEVGEAEDVGHDEDHELDHEEAHTYA